MLAFGRQGALHCQWPSWPRIDSSIPGAETSAFRPRRKRRLRSRHEHFAVTRYSTGVKLVVTLKLSLAPGQAETLVRTLRQANAAANFVSDEAWRAKTFRAFALHKIVYY